AQSTTHLPTALARILSCAEDAEKRIKDAEKRIEDVEKRALAAEELIRAYRDKYGDLSLKDTEQPL
ncbi:MAG: hypothetical protein IJ860_07420, partial [Eubacterium sp.]|nr:hypothetical protein [Eubacterium sp.]